MVAIRDAKVAADIGQMEGLGWFQQEYIVYGCAYLHNGERHYRVSNNYAEISGFQNNAILKGIYATPPIEWLNRMLVPSGMSNEFMTKTKIQMAKRLQKQYPKEFLVAFDRLASTEPIDSVEPLLRDIQRKMIGCFDKKTLALVQGLVKMAYEQKKLTSEGFRFFDEWVKARLQQMADDTVIKKNVKRSFYGFGYKEMDGREKIYVNVNEDAIFKRRNMFLQQQKLCTPIISQTYYFKQTPDISKERERFTEQMSLWMDEEYWQYVDAIQKAESPISVEAFENLLSSVQNYDADIQNELSAVMMHYKTIWNM